MPRKDEWLICQDAAVCHGEPTIRETRIPVRVVLDNLAAGLTTDEVLAGYPALTVEAIRAAVAYDETLTRSEDGED